MKMNLPGIHGGISQQSPHLRLQNQHSDALNTVYDVLDGMRSRWGTSYKGLHTNPMFTAIGDIETTDGKQWVVSWYNNKFYFMDMGSPEDTYELSPSDSYMPSGTNSYKRVRTLPILDTMILVNVDKPVATSTSAEYYGAARAMLYIPQVFEGLNYNVQITVVTTKAGAFPVGTTLKNAALGGTVGSGDTPETIIDALLDPTTGLMPDDTYINSTKVGTNMLYVELTAAALAMEPTITLTSVSDFDIRTYSVKLAPKVSPTDTTYYVTTTKSYEDLPPSGGSGVTFEISEGYYVYFDGTSYVETTAPGMKTKLDKATMPHELRYDPTLLPSNPWTYHVMSDYDSWGRLVGDNTSAPLPDFVGRTINNVFFYRNRLGILSDNYIALSAVGKYYNWFPETAQEVTDSDPIIVFPTSIRFSELLWAIPFGKQLVLLSATKQYILHSGYEALTPQTIAVDEATNYKLLPQVEPLVLEASIVLALDHGDYAGILEYRVDDQQIATEGSLLSSVVPNFIPSDITHMVYLPAEHMVLIHERGSIPIYTYKFNKREDGQLTQMAWSQWAIGEHPVSFIVRTSGTKLVLLTSDNQVLEMDTAASKSAITMDYQQSLTLDDGDTIAGAITDTVVVTSTGKELEVDSDTGVVTTNSSTPLAVTTGIAIQWYNTLSPLVLRDDNGLPRADLDATIENMTVDWEGGAFSLTISGQGLPSRTKVMIPETTTLVNVAAGTSLTEVTPTRFLVMAPAKRVTLTLSGSAYFPTRINNISYNLYVTKDRG